MRVVNNKISMYRGETPSYVARVYKDDGTPLILTDPAKNYQIEFIVRPDVYSRENYLFRRYLNVDVVRFASTDIIEYIGEEWLDGEPPRGNAAGKLHRLKVDGEYEYRYYENDVWKLYEFEIQVDFPHEETKHFEPKKYYYEISLLQVADSVTPPEEIIKKTVIIPPHEFNVEGSIGV